METELQLELVFVLSNENWYSRLLALADEVKGSEYVFFKTYSDIEKFMVPGKRQVLFLDGFNFHLEGAADTASVMKQINPELLVVIVGVHSECQQPFDECLDMRDSPEELAYKFRRLIPDLLTREKLVQSSS